MRISHRVGPSRARADFGAECSTPKVFRACPRPGSRRARSSSFRRHRCQAHSCWSCVRNLPRFHHPREGQRWPPPRAIRHRLRRDENRCAVRAASVSKPRKPPKQRARGAACPQGCGFALEHVRVERTRAASPASTPSIRPSIRCSIRCSIQPRRVQARLHAQWVGHRQARSRSHEMLWCSTAEPHPRSMARRG